MAVEAQGIELTPGEKGYQRLINLLVKKFEIREYRGITEYNLNLPDKTNLHALRWSSFPGSETIDLSCNQGGKALFNALINPNGLRGLNVAKVTTTVAGIPTTTTDYHLGFTDSATMRNIAPEDLKKLRNAAEPVVNLFEQMIRKKKYIPIDKLISSNAQTNI